MNDAMVLLEGATEPDLRSAAAGGGEFVAYTCRAPDKDTENEDTVAVIPYGPGAAVMLVADGAGGLPAGKRASLTAAQSLAESLQRSMAETMLLRTAILDGIEILGWEMLLLALGTDPRRFGDLVQRYAEWIGPYFGGRRGPPRAQTHGILRHACTRTISLGPVRVPD